MADENKNNNSEFLDKNASVASTVKGAVEAGKAIADIAKGTAAGGPYGAIIAGLKNAKAIGKLIAFIIFLLAIPILYVLMLPSIIFGDLGLDTADASVMNNNGAIVGNIQEIEIAVGSILRESHDDILSYISFEKTQLSEDTITEIRDPYEDEILFNIDLIISQYCVSKGNYKDINVSDLITLIKLEQDNLFKFTSETEIITEEDEDGNEILVTKITYTIEYAGDSYFAENVFHLTDEQKILADEYAYNLNLFLSDDYNSQAAAIHKSLSDLFTVYPYEWTDEQFNSPFADMDWQAQVTSEYGSRKDPITGVSGAFHTGIDIAYPKGTLIRASKSGVVVTSEKKTTGYGYRIIINHGGGYATLYAHCSELLVSVGDKVSAGDIIAKVGTTGRSTGNHLHFEIIFDGTAKNPRDYIGR